MPEQFQDEAVSAKIDIIQRDIDEINALGESVATPWQIKGKLKAASKEASATRDQKKKFVDDAQATIEANATVNSECSK